MIRDGFNGAKNPFCDFRATVHGGHGLDVLLDLRRKTH